MADINRPEHGQTVRIASPSQTDIAPAEGTGIKAYGDDILFGDAGVFTVNDDEDDILFSARGDDILFGSEGNACLSGGFGIEHLYGGTGDDIPVYHSVNFMDGASGLDALLVSMTDASMPLDELLNVPRDTEVVIKIDGEATRDNLADMGIRMENDGLHLSGGGWSLSGGDGRHAIYENAGAGAMVIVNNSQTDVEVVTNDILIKTAAS
ncbi:MAG: hypothetical protein LBC94_00680 [Desulfovibrio sp.]|jgi:hypothetical protein|nr:hypothetical protein [Desulfovibrio sp.]